MTNCAAGVAECVGMAAIKTTRREGILPRVASPVRNAVGTGCVAAILSGSFPGQAAGGPDGF